MFIPLATIATITGIEILYTTVVVTILLIRLVSIIDERCIKESKGHYYYKGYEINNKGHLWHYGIVGIIKPQLEARTLRQTKLDIDYITKNMTTDEIIYKVKRTFKSLGIKEN